LGIDSAVKCSPERSGAAGGGEKAECRACGPAAVVAGAAVPPPEPDPQDATSVATASAAVVTAMMCRARILAIHR
jgi:hypothetical protein